MLFFFIFVIDMHVYECISISRWICAIDMHVAETAGKVVLFFLVFLGPTSGKTVTLKTGRREVPGSNPGRVCRPSRSEFSVVFSETRVNTG